jgi:hypothetical protein
MKTVIAEDQARAEIELWCEHFEVELAELEIKALLPAVMRGRVVFDEDKDSFTITLKSPIELENGNLVRDITLREPTAGELQEANKNKADEMTLAIKLYSKLSGYPLGVIQRMKQKDLIVAGEFFGSFFA